MQLKRTGSNYQVVGFGQLPVPENYIIEGIIAEPEKLADKIKECIQNNSTGKISATRVYASLPESKIFTRTISLPHANDKSIEEAVSWDASQTVPMAMTDLYLDWQVVGPSIENSTMDDVLYAAAPKAIVNSYVQLYSILGYELAGIETSLTAIIRAIKPRRKTSEAALIIDIGGQTTNLAIFDNAIRVTGSTLIGGEQLTYRIAEALKVSEAAAEKMKKSKGGKETEKTKKALDSAVTQICSEATTMINYYQEKDKQQVKVSRIYVCGGSASLPSLAEVFSEKLGINTEVVDKLEGMIPNRRVVLPEESVPAYINAIGLALLGVYDD